ncbi:MAG: hypothetical protein Q8Q28_12820 [Pseudomonadota bacterium]|nr:hypothetical protein [Pseudomonadota bacterium]
MPARGALLWLAGACLVGMARAASAAESSVDLSVRTRALFFGMETQLSPNSPFNPDNRIAALPRTELELHLRPDFTVSGEGWEAVAKPRAIGRHTRTQSAGQELRETDATLVLNEAWLRGDFGAEWVATLGRKVVLWGPSMFVSPSNPFFVDNGRSNPYREIHGRDFAQIYYFANDSLSLQGIVNTGRGEAVSGVAAFQPVAALKLDWTGATHGLSLILSGKEGEAPRLGGYGQITASQGLLLYGEGALQRGSAALYPERPAGDFIAREQDSNRLYATALVGAAYTLAAGPTLHIEYVHNNEGYSDGEAADYYDLARDLSQQMGVGGAAAVLGKGLNPKQLLLRRNYLFAQYLHTNIGNSLDATLRYTHNLDDGSGMFVPILSWNATDRLQLFALGVFNRGGARSEFGPLLHRQVMLGAQLFLD